MLSTKERSKRLKGSESASTIGSICQIATDVVFCGGCSKVPVAQRGTVLCLLIAGCLTLIGNILLLQTIGQHYNSHYAEYVASRPLEISTVLDQVALKPGILPPNHGSLVDPAKSLDHGPRANQPPVLTTKHTVATSAGLGVWSKLTLGDCGEIFGNGFSETFHLCGASPSEPM